MSKTITRINPASLAKPNGFMHITTWDSVVFISGQVSYDASGAIVGEGDIAKQAHQVLSNLKRALEEVGTDFNHVVKMNYYIRDISEEAVAKIRDVRQHFFADGLLPASTMVGVAGLAKPALLLEIEAYALIP